MRLTYLTGMAAPYVRSEIAEWERAGQPITFVSDGATRGQLVRHPELADLDASGRLHAPEPLAETRAMRRLNVAVDLAKAACTSPVRTVRVAKLANEASTRKPVDLRNMFGHIARFPGGIDDDVVFVHSGMVGRRAAVLKAAGHIPGRMIVKFNGLDAFIPHHRGNGARYRHMFDTVDRLGHGTDFMRNVLIEMGAPPEKMLFTPSSIPLDTFKFRERRADTDDQYRIVTTARLIPWKAIESSIRAIATLRDRGINARFDVFGDGPLEGPLNRQAAELGVGDAVTLHGRVPYDRLLQGLQGSDVFLINGIVDERGAYENQCLSVSEASAVGLPVVAVALGGIPEATAFPDAGTLFQAGHQDELIEALTQMWENRADWPTLARAGRDYVESRFDVRRTVDHYREEFRRLSGSH